MTAFMLQSALLLLVAYFAGCFLGCLARRMTFDPRAAEAFEAGNVQTAAVPAQIPTAKPAPLPVQMPTQAPTGVTPEGATTAAARFERALTSAGSSAATTVAAPAPVAPPVAERPAPTPPTAPVIPIRPQAPVQSAEQTVASTPVSPTVAIPAAAAAATAAAAAAAAAAKLATSATVETKSTAAPMLPSAMGSSGPATVVASVTSAPAVPRAEVPVATGGLEDLTRIRAIDTAMQSALNGLNVKSYADIAGWKPGDVSRVAGALKIPGRIEQENWIEQAQILAKGGETYYSRRKQNGELVSSKPTPDEGDRITIRVPAATRPTELSPSSGPSTPVAPVAAPVVAPAVVAAPVINPPDPATADIKAAATAAAAAVAAASAKIAPSVAAPAATSAPVTAVAAAPAAQAVPVPPPTAAAVSAPAVGTTRDTLQRIAGINAEVEKLLNVQGVTRYSQIANWSSADISRFDRLLGFEGRIARENWIEQANILAKGGETAFARDQARKAADATMPARLNDAILSQKAAASAGSGGEASSRSELSNLRSVRSEAYRGPDSANAASGPADDLKRIRGVGVLIEKKLNALGVTRYDQVANWTSADIERYSDKLDFKGRIERENWVEQARILSAGGQTEFSQRVDRGEVETSKPS